MAVQVLIRRKVVPDKVKEVGALMVELRSLASAQEGYISSESLRCIDPRCDDEYVIRGTWQSHDLWLKWLNSLERSVIQEQIDDLTGEKTEYRVYEALVGGILSKPVG